MLETFEIKFEVNIGTCRSNINVWRCLLNQQAFVYIMYFDCATNPIQYSSTLVGITQIARIPYCIVREPALQILSDTFVFVDQVCSRPSSGLCVVLATRTWLGVFWDSPKTCTCQGQILEVFCFLDPHNALSILSHRYREIGKY